MRHVGGRHGQLLHNDLRSLSDSRRMNMIQFPGDMQRAHITISFHKFVGGTAKLNDQPALGGVLLKADAGSFTPEFMLEIPVKA